MGGTDGKGPEEGDGERDEGREGGGWLVGKKRDRDRDRGRERGGGEEGGSETVPPVIAARQCLLARQALARHTAGCAVRYRWTTQGRGSARYAGPAVSMGAGV